MNPIVFAVLALLLILSFGAALAGLFQARRDARAAKEHQQTLNDQFQRTLTLLEKANLDRRRTMDRLAGSRMGWVSTYDAKDGTLPELAREVRRERDRLAEWLRYMVHVMNVDHGEMLIERNPERELAAAEIEVVWERRDGVSVLYSRPAGTPDDTQEVIA